ncbi:hypothetical protein GIB67_002154 [Kingdonia uniflora]|uniref:Uncharacterized protein n=1 Tax=Kingdonia uniflora TaxID=39325 RepID=A0A7J7KWK9_9MAGN|nr:hypothetical protein GIB67_002154 [Kingdonia uniflora]
MYKASDMESGKDASVLESRTVRARGSKWQPHEREKINSSSSSPSNRFATKDLESNQRERRKIKGINQEFFEDDKRLKRAKSSGSRRWEYSSVVRRNLDSSIDSYPDIEENFVKPRGLKEVRVVPPPHQFGEGGNECNWVMSSSNEREYVGGQTWNDNIIWVKGNCLQRDDEEFMDLRFRFVKKSVKSTVERKESLLDEAAEEGTKLELVLGELSLSRKKRVKSKSKKVSNAQSARSMAGVDEGMRQTSGDKVQAKTPGSGSSAPPNLTTSKIAHKFLKRQIKKAMPASGATVSMDELKEVEEWAKLAILQGKEDTSQMVARLVEGIWLGIEEQESELKKVKSELEKNLAQAKTDALKEVKQLKAAHAVAISQLQVEVKANLDETAEEHNRLGCRLMLKGYSKEEEDAIKADTYVEEEEEEAGLLGVMDSLDGVSPQTVLDNQGDDVELPEDGSEKAVKEMSLRINDLEFGLAREIKTSKALLSVQAELQVELDVSRARKDHSLMCNQKFAEQFDKIKETNANSEDQFVNVHFRLENVNQVTSDLTRQVEEKDYGIKKGLGDLPEAKKRAENLQRQVDVLAAKGKQTDMAQYHIQALERTEELCRSDLNSCRIELERMRQKFIGKDDELRVARENLSATETTAEHLQTVLSTKDMEF